MSKHHFIKIKDWIFDPSTKTLFKDDASDESVSLENKQCLLLQFLIENHSQVVNRDQLIETVWFGRIVEELTINAVVSRLRKVLGGDKNDYIKTHPKIGYSLVCEVKFIEKEIIEPETIKVTSKENDQLNNINSAKAYPIKLFAVISALAILLVLIFNLISNSTNIENKKMTNDNIPRFEPPVPLTYLEGHEFNPAISPNKNLLAFVHKKTETANMQVIVKNINSNKVVSLDPSRYTASPTWSSNGEYLYYQEYLNKKCLIKRTKITQALTFSDPQIITSCGNLISISPLTIKNNWLYFSYSESHKQPLRIKRMHLISKQQETLTSPTIKDLGDYSFSLNFDGSKIAFIRSTSSNYNLMYLDLLSGEVKVLKKLNHAAYYVDWSPSDDLIIYIDAKESLKAINIHNLKERLLYQSSEKIFSPKVISNNEVLLSFGDPFTKNVKSLNLMSIEPKMNDLITSSFDDFGATSYQNEKHNLIAFISNRSGEKQIWLSDNNELSQLTHFTDNNLIADDLRFSDDGNSLIFTKNQQLLLIHINEKETIALTKTPLLAKNAIWACNNHNTVFTSIYDKGNWDLFKINTLTLNKTKLLTSIESIRGDCSNNTYYINQTFNNDIYKLNSNLEIIKNKIVSLNKPHSSSLKWQVNANQIYNLNTDTKKLYKIHLLTQEKTLMISFDNYVYDFSISNEKLIFNSRTLHNTYIAKVPIKIL
ncbi:winged helix-turn-helix domain-containing protein [Pseudoalteromonas sp. NBT06-2]|uniref:winged helix-turn-helix domain-containing protein n=1 Tax=Pseudoalteromonas sp. NBT06-2 TaxID=2025950 RepID=UPI00148253C4|nr:winged helix-turn-helix domain-containing protein [Pseudoalteromonas sp. NBT06-2]